VAFPTSWLSKRKLTIDHTKISGSSNLTNFPVLVADGNFNALVYAGATVNDTHSLDLELSSSQYAKISDASQTGLDITGNITIEAWIKFEQLPSTAGTVFAIATKWKEPSSFAYRFQIDSVNFVEFSYSADGDFTNVRRMISDAAVFTSADVGVWVHLAASITVATGTMLLYKNETLIANTSSGSDTAIFNSSASFAIGATDVDGTPASFFDGLIKEVRVWNVARTAAQIIANYKYSLLGTETGLVGYWRMNNNYNDTTSDANNLTSSGSPVFSTSTPNLFPIDLRFSSDSAGTTELPFEIVAWDDGNSLAEVWVKVPSVTTATDTVFYVWYNNSGASPYAPTDTFGSQSVWTDYAAVYHGQNNTNDSTAGASNGSDTSVSDAAGEIGRGRSFNGTTSVSNIGSAAALDGLFTSGGTFQAWCNPVSSGESDSGRFVDKTTDSLTDGYLILTDNVSGSTSAIRIIQGFNTSPGRWETTSLDLTFAVWQVVAVTYNNSSSSNDPLIYKNGVSKAITEVTTPSGTAGSDAAATGYLGNRAAQDRTFDGVLDEIRFRKSILTADWLVTEYNNQNSPSTFIADGAPTNILKVSGVAYASIGKIAGVAIGSVGKVAGVA
jgi:hypothetical protein